MPKFDLAKTDALMKLFGQPRELRDKAWRSAFLDAVVDASMASTAEQVMTGPDGFPYFALIDPPVAQGFTPFCVSALLDHCTDKGIGIVVNPRDGSADWALTYGDLWSLRAYGSFSGDPDDAGEVRDPATGLTLQVLAEDTGVVVGKPNERMLPSWARPVLASFLTQEANIPNPGVLVMVDDHGSQRPSRRMVFNAHIEDFPSLGDFRRFMGALRWFLPPKRALLGISRDSIAVSSFVPLT